MSSNFILETERTYMRPLSTQDTEFFYNLNKDEEVLKYTGDKPFSTIHEAHDFLTNYNQYNLYNTGRMLVVEKETNENLGWCGIKYTAETQEYDIGFRFLKKYWNKGFATETAFRNLEYGFQELQIPFILGKSMLANIASIKVLEKLGMKKVREQEFALHKGILYAITHADFTQITP